MVPSVFIICWSVNTICWFCKIEFSNFRL